MPDYLEGNKHQGNFDVLDGLQNHQSSDPRDDKQPKKLGDSNLNREEKKHYSLMSTDPKIEYGIVSQSCQNVALQKATQNASQNIGTFQHHREHHQPLQRNLSSGGGKKKSMKNSEGDAGNQESQLNKKSPLPLTKSKNSHGLKKIGTQSSLGSDFSTPLFNTTVQSNFPILHVSKNRPLSAGQYDSIQAAIDDASPQSIILISPGIYLQPITITKPVKIFSELKYNEMCHKLMHSGQTQKLGINNSSSDQQMSSKQFEIDHHNQSNMPSTIRNRQSSLTAEQTSAQRASVLGSSSIPDFPSTLNPNQNQKVYILSSKGPAITIATNVKNQVLDPHHSPYVQLFGIRIGHLGPKQEGTQIIKLSLVQNPCPDIFKQFDIIEQDRIECGIFVKKGYISLTDCIVSLGTIPITMNLKLSCILAFNGTRVHLKNTTVRGHRIHPTSGIVTLNSDFVKIQDSKIYQCPSGGILCRGSPTDVVQIKDCKIRDCALAGMYFLGESEDEYKLRGEIQQEQHIKYSLNHMNQENQRFKYQPLQQKKYKENITCTNIWQTEKIFNVFRTSVLRSEFKNIQGDGISTSWGVYGIVGGCKFDLCRVAVRCRLSNLKIFVNWVSRCLESGIVTQGVNGEKYLAPTMRPCSSVIFNKIFKQIIRSD